jgi:xanthine dehydrogenase small subunit
LVVEANLWHRRWATLVSLEAVQELEGIRWTDDALEIGAAVSLSHLEEEVGDQVPLFGQLFPLFSSRLIRNRATLGGNLVNASPIGDSPPALLALDAEVELRSRGGARRMPLHEFFLDYRKTALHPGEVLAVVRIPRPFPNVGRFYKVSKRILDDISTVAAGFCLRLDATGHVERARFAFGGVAATPLRAYRAEDAIVGKEWSAATAAQVRQLLQGAFTPLTDHRGSAEYRSRMVPMLFDKFVHELGEMGP